jgi:hypothetical protein
MSISSHSSNDRKKSSEKKRPLGNQGTKIVKAQTSQEGVARLPENQRNSIPEKVSPREVQRLPAIEHQKKLVPDPKDPKKMITRNALYRRIQKQKEKEELVPDPDNTDKMISKYELSCRKEREHQKKLVPDPKDPNKMITRNTLCKRIQRQKEKEELVPDPKDLNKMISKHDLSCRKERERQKKLVPDPENSNKMITRKASRQREYKRERVPDPENSNKMITRNALMVREYRRKKEDSRVFISNLYSLKDGSLSNDLGIIADLSRSANDSYQGGYVNDGNNFDENSAVKEDDLETLPSFPLNIDLFEQEALFGDAEDNGDTKPSAEKRQKK